MANGDSSKEKRKYLQHYIQSNKHFITAIENGQSQPESSKKRPVASSSTSNGQPSGPSAGLRVLLQNAGSFLFDDFSDDREDCLTRSIRIQAALVLLSLAEQICRNSNAPSVPNKKKRVETTVDCVKGDAHHAQMSLLLKRYEHRISLIAASRQDASPVLARLLALMP